MAQDESSDPESSDTNDNLDEALHPGAGHTPRFIVSPSVRIAARYRINRDVSLQVFVRHKQAMLEPLTMTRGTNIVGGIQSSVKISGFVWKSQIEAKQSFVNFYGIRDYTALIVTTGLARNFDIGGLGLTFTPSFEVNYQQADLSILNRVKYSWEGSFGYSLSDKLGISFGPKLDVRAYTNLGVRRVDTTGRLGGGFDYEVTKWLTLASELGYELSKSNLSRPRFAHWVLEPQVKIKFSF